MISVALNSELTTLRVRRSSMSLLPPRQTNGGKMVLYAFDVDQTLWLSDGPIQARRSHGTSE
jgi:hypothetical protein